MTNLKSLSLVYVICALLSSTFVRADESAITYSTEVSPELSIETGLKGSECLQNFKKRRDRFAIGTAVTPVAGAGGVVAGAYAGGLIGAVSLSHAAGGWGTLVGAVLGIEFGAFTVAATSIGLEIGFAVELARAEKMYQLVHAVENGSGKAIDRSYKKFIRKHPEFRDKVTEDEYSKQIFEWSQSKALCDGSLKNKKPKPNETRLRKLLVSPKELDRALVKEFKTKS